MWSGLRGKAEWESKGLRGLIWPGELEVSRATYRRGSESFMMLILEQDEFEVSKFVGSPKTIG